MSMPISLAELDGTEGFILSETIYNHDGTSLFAEGRLLDSTTVQLLKNYFRRAECRVKDVFIPVNYKLELELKLKKEQNHDISGNVSQKLKNNTLEALFKTYTAPEESLAENITVIGNCVAEIARYIEKNQDLSYSLGQYKTSSNVFNHSLRVAQFSVALANIYNKKLGQKEEKIDLKSIGTAALLHDFGIRYQDKKEMEKLSSKHLSDTFFDFYPTIPSTVLEQPYEEKYKNVYTYTALGRFLDSTTKTMILLSGEGENERANIVSKETKKDAISTASKIIYLCNLYDSLLYNTIQADINLENVSSLVAQLVENKVVDKELGNLLLNEIPLYSTGVRVLLSTGEYATVIESFRGNEAAKPIVKTMVNPPFQPRKIDLRETTTTTILKIIASDEKLSDKVEKITSEQIRSINMGTKQTENLVEENNLKSR